MEVQSPPQPFRLRHLPLTEPLPLTIYPASGGWWELREETEARRKDRGTVAMKPSPVDERETEFAGSHLAVQSDDQSSAVCPTEKIQYVNATCRKRILWNMRTPCVPAAARTAIDAPLMQAGTSAVRVGSGVCETVVQRDRSLDMISRGVAQVLNK